MVSSAYSRAYFRGRRVLVTGGSLGIGLALAHQLAQAGASLLLVARRSGPLEEARGAVLRAVPTAEVTVRALDVGDLAALPAAADALLRQHPIDVLINNAGVSQPGRFRDTSPEAYEHHLRINFHGPVALTRTAIPHLLARGGGDIVNVGSIAGALGVYGYTAYAASKFALHGFSECLRGELAPLGIRVSLVLPPETDTPMLAAEQAHLPAETRAIAGTIRTLSADTVARAILDGVARGRFEIVPGAAALWTLRLARAWPGLFRAYCDWRQRQVAR